MNLHQAIEFIEESDKFKKFIKEHNHYTLAHAFCTVEKAGQSPWQIGYYSKKTTKIATFTADEEVIQGIEDEAFIKQGHVPPLAIDDVTTSYDEAMKKADNIHQEKHKAENITKKIVILQTLEGKPTWNITSITHAFNMINVRVDATDGTLLHSETQSILNLGQRV